MAAQYRFKLVVMAQRRSRAGPPGEMYPSYLPIDDQGSDLLFVFRDGMASFEPMGNEQKNLKPKGTKAWFLALGSQLKLEAYTNNVHIESPPCNDLPRYFEKTYIPSSLASPESPREIYLRPHDTVVFDDEGCSVVVSVEDSSRPTTTSISHGSHSADAAEIQVKSSARQSFATRDDAEPELGLNDEGTEDGDDLDGSVNTPTGMEDATPATSRPTGPAVKETPTRPATRDSNLLYSTAPDSRISQHANTAHGVDRTTPAARAGTEQGRLANTKVKAADDGDLQFVFPNANGQVTYGGTPRQKRKSTSKDEILESPTKDHVAGSVQSSSGKKRSLHETEVQDEDEIKLSTATAPPTKRPRGRPSKAQKSGNVAAQEKQHPTSTNPSGSKARGRPKETSLATEAVALRNQPPNSGKLKRPGRKSGSGADEKVEVEDDEDEHEDESENEDGDETAMVTVTRSKLSPDLDSRASSTPQSSGTPLAGKTPKVLLSGSTYAEVSKAKSWLKKQGAPVEEKVPGKRTNFVCVVGSGELHTTAKVVRSLARGKKVVTDQWITDSMEADQLLDLDKYIHDDLDDTTKVNRGKLFEGKVIFITNTLMKRYGDGFADIKDLAADVGARHVETGSWKKAVNLSTLDLIILGAAEGDTDALKLTQEEGRIVYQKDLLTQSIIRGALLCNDNEFHWKPAATGKGKKGKK